MIPRLVLNEIFIPNFNSLLQYITFMQVQIGKIVSSSGVVAPVAIFLV